MSNENIVMQLKELSRKEFLYKIKDAQSFDLTKEEISNYFDFIFYYILSQYSNVLYSIEHSDRIEPLSKRQEVCSQNAICCLLEQNFIQALHETLDILHDYNKDTSLNYNEYIVLSNIVMIYSYFKDKEI